MNELALQAAIAELENQRNWYQLRCIQMAQEIARLVKEAGERNAATPPPSSAD